MTLNTVFALVEINTITLPLVTYFSQQQQQEYDHPTTLLSTTPLSFPL